jgi:NgoFVII restriction endonuclease
MSVTSTVLFELPQQEIASLISSHIDRSSETSIVSGFATPGGLAAITTPIRQQPLRLKTLIVAAATYAGFSALDDLITAGVPANRLHVHLGYTNRTGGVRPPFIKYHPMLHSKVYYMEHSTTKASAFIGSHNLTSFALAGLNGEAAVVLERPRQSPGFGKIRKHIATAQRQAAPYSSAMKEAYAWWTREFFDGMQSEVGLPSDWSATRTIILFASVAPGARPSLAS